MRFLLRAAELILLVGLVLAISAGAAPAVQYATKLTKTWFANQRISITTTAQFKEDAESEDERPVLNADPLRFDPDEFNLMNTDFSKVPHHPVAFVKFDPVSDLSRIAQRIWYFRVAGFDRYTSNRWMQSDEFEMIRDDNDGTQDGISTVDPLGTAPCFYTVFLPHLTYDALPGLSRTAWIKLPEVKRSLNDTYFLPAGIPTRRLRYEMVSSPNAWSDIQTVPSQPPPAHPNFTDIDDRELMFLLKQMIPQQARAAGNMKARIEILLATFRTSYLYDRGGPESSVDNPMASFLQGERRGDCKHFATAMTLMLRDLGIPARLAVGYAGGEFDTQQGMLTFFADDGHAWVEALIDEDNWVTIDPTPPVLDFPPHAPVPVEGGFRSSGADFPELAGLIGSAHGLQDLAGAAQTSSGGAFSMNFSQLLFTATCLGCVGIGGLIILLTGCFQKKTVSKRQRITRRHRLPRFLRLFLRHYAKVGMPYRPGQTLCEYLNEVQTRGLADEEFNDLVAYVYGISYADLPRDPEAEQTFVETVNRKH